MSWQHLRAILWLRWRMSINQLRRSGIANRILLAFLGVLALITSAGMFISALLLGVFVLPGASPETVMLVWDALVVGFLCFWIVGLLTELQQSEILSMQKLLHMPVSLSGTFVINYLGSWISVTMILFLPGMIGMGIALVIAKGPSMLILIPTLLGFLLVVTSLTYQFQGWLAAIMVNKRRRRAVIAALTFALVLTSQLPSLIMRPDLKRWSDMREELSADIRRRQLDLDQNLQAGRITPEQHIQEHALLHTEYARRFDAIESREYRWMRDAATRMNLLLPIGWLPYGAMALAKGDPLPAMAGALAMSLIAAVSLASSYRTALRLYTGQPASARARRTRRPAAAVAVARPSAGLMVKSLPRMSEQTTAVALASFISLIRAPEARLVLLTPLIMVVVFGSMLLSGTFEPPAVTRPLMALGGLGVAMLTLVQLMSNQFGLDRDGFRALVLSGCPRRDILLGKNISFAPVALGLAVLMTALLQIFYPLRPDHLIATLVDSVTTFLIICIAANFASVFAPMPFASGSLKPANPKAMTVVVHVLFTLMLPVMIGITAMPLGIEMLLHHMGWLQSVPIYLLGALCELVFVLWIYHGILQWQGRLLQDREQTVLAVVTTKVE